MDQSQFFSQSQSQAEDPLWASIPLIKFSHTTQLSSRPSPWTHLDKDLKLEIQTFRVIDEQGVLGRKVVMKVFSKDTLLELQDLGQLVRISQTDASLVVLVENRPRLAMRYPKDPDTVRKCEMKFSSDTDFFIITNAIKDLGLPVKPHVPRVSVLPSPVPTSLNSSSPAIPVSFLQESHSRPSSASSGFVKPPPVTTFNPSGRFEDIKRPATAESLQQKTEYSQPIAGILDPRIRSVPLATQSRSQAFSFFEPTKPSYSLQLERESQNRQLSQPISQPVSQPTSQSMLQEPSYAMIASQAKSSTFLHQLQSQQANNAERPTSRPPLPSKSPFFPSIQSATSKSVGTIPDPFVTSVLSGNSVRANLDIMLAPPRRKLPFDRPASTPVESQDPDIPARQNLPFRRPESKPRSSSLLDLPPLPKPTPIAKTHLRETTDITTTPGSIKAAPVKRVAERKAPVSEIEQVPTSKILSQLKSLTHDTTIIPPPVHGDESSPLAAKSAAASRPASATSGLVSKASAPSRKRVATPVFPPSNTKRAKMVDQGTQTQTTVDHSTQTQNTSGPDQTNGNAPAVSMVPGVVPTTSAVVAPPQSYLDDLDAFVTAHRPRPAPVELWEIPGYADADEDARHAMLNDFIIQNLEDPNFLKLCDDMGNAWRRIGLGR
ncbi:uncharacterized protein RAG0_04641 [Rhynchosporium agropyri]|uniref:Uncharacterized protein n=1 Tax=Rhynchosporium agropyri TaxID=914238 RepID=A0A1E1K9M3_9HELO|nr:uncharacterized protein RAG0_04641 [Rhynchosporium agropyri]